jgi:hypothetical protein
MWFKRKQKMHPLDVPLLHFTPYGLYRIRDILNGGLLILARSGSGKTSSSGRVITQKIVNHPNSGGLVLLPKPEDIEVWLAIFRKAGRMKDVIVFSAEGDRRCNLLGYLKRPRDVVQFLTTMSEIMKRGDSKGGGEGSQFYDKQEERTLYNTVAALQAAKEPLTAPNMQKFIMTAARTPEELDTPEWQQKHHSLVLERAYKAQLTPMERHDFLLFLDYWTKEWCGLMDLRTRGNILATTQGTLHTMNTGIVREMGAISLLRLNP